MINPIMRIRLFVFLDQSLIKRYTERIIKNVHNGYHLIDEPQSSISGLIAINRPVITLSFVEFVI